MKTTIDIPESLYKKAKIRAVERGQTLRDIVLRALEHELEIPAQPGEEAVAAAPPRRTWANRELLPEYEALLKAGAFRAGTDSTRIISEERDAR